MNVATYLKFDGISNVLVEVKPTALASELLLEQPPVASSDRLSQLAGKSQPLDTSFNVHMTLGNALDQLQQPSAAGQQTPALGKCRHHHQHSVLTFNTSSGRAKMQPLADWTRDDLDNLLLLATGCCCSSSAKKLFALLNWLGSGLLLFDFAHLLSARTR